MKDEQEPTPKPEPSSPPPRPPRGPTVATGFSGDEEPEDKASPKPTIKLPTLPPGGPTFSPGAVATTSKIPAGSKKRRPWWKFW